MKGKKFFLTIFLFFLLTSGLIGASILVQRKQLVEKKAAGGNSSITLPTALPSAMTPGEEFPVPLQVNTDGLGISGVDLVLEFPIDKFSLINIQPEAQTTTALKTFAPVREDGNFDLAAVVDKANSSGRIEFRAMTFDWQTETITASFNGLLGPANPLAILTFKVKPELTIPGVAVITLLHTPGKTTDSNLVASETGIDVLVKTNSLEVEIVPPKLPLRFSLTPTLSPTPIATVSPTISPTTSPTPTLTITPSLIPTPTTQ